MNKKHAPGPWRFDKDSLNVYSSGMVAAVFGHVHTGEKEANARLIAAAPDMLTVLKEMKARKYESASQNGWDQRLDAIIAKAEGESHE